MVGENFEIYPSEMAKNAPNHPPWLEKILRFTHQKWLKTHLIIHHGCRQFSGEGFCGEGGGGGIDFTVEVVDRQRVIKNVFRF